MYNVIILFGVSGCGKSLIGNQLSKDLQFEFIEGDDFHSNENIKKMKNNIPLNDDDREAWLDQINKELNKLRNRNVVIACSALKEKYRSILDVKEDYLVYLKITKKTAKTRIKNRKDHFMPDSLVDSQFAILEEPNVCITLEETLTPEEATSHLTSIIKNKFNYGK